ncbi:MAG: 30S ribosome-binding factor RbfA [Planctomycetota bacterium]|jgi:ribosome-binding factor A|nr:30S ribosome-binding factor RbfA [Planctomycetota bacterium]
MPSRRQERVAKRIIQELIDAFRGLKHADLGFLTLTGCETSPDLRHAKVRVSVFGSDEDRERVITLLRQNASRLRRAIGRPLGLKNTPELHFEFDSSLEVADNISRLIRDARSTDINPNPLPPAEAAAASGLAEPKRDVAVPAADAFESARLEVEADLPEFGEEDDDPAWRPINLDEPPDDGD